MKKYYYIILLFTISCTPVNRLIKSITYTKYPQNSEFLQYVKIDKALTVEDTVTCDSVKVGNIWVSKNTYNAGTNFIVDGGIIKEHDTIKLGEGIVKKELHWYYNDNYFRLKLNPLDPYFYTALYKYNILDSAYFTNTLFYLSPNWQNFYGISYSKKGTKEAELGLQITTDSIFLPYLYVKGKKELKVILDSTGLKCDSSLSVPKYSENSKYNYVIKRDVDSLFQNSVKNYKASKGITLSNDTFKLGSGVIPNQLYWQDTTYNNYLDLKLDSSDAHFDLTLYKFNSLNSNYYSLSWIWNDPSVIGLYSRSNTISGIHNAIIGNKMSNTDSTWTPYIYRSDLGKKMGIILAKNGLCYDSSYYRPRYSELDSNCLVPKIYIDSLFDAAGNVDTSAIPFLVTTNTFTQTQTAPKWATTGGTGSQLVTGNGSLITNNFATTTKVQSDSSYLSALINTKGDTIFRSVNTTNIFSAKPRAGNGVTTTTYSNFIGYQAGNAATSASNSNFLGYQAGYGATSASYSNFFGNTAGNAATSASYSNFLGYNSGASASDASYSNFIGYNSGNGATSASYSNFFGYYAGIISTSASYSNFLGYYAGYNAASASHSNFLGYNVGNGATSANYSNFFGDSTGYKQTKASYSVLLGYKAGKFYTGDTLNSNNIIIGNNITLPNSSTNRLNIGGIIFGTGLYSTMSGNPSYSAVSGGKIGIGTNSPSTTLHVNGNTTSNYYLNSSGDTLITKKSISSSATGLTYSNGSGIFSLTSGYSIPTTANLTNYSNAYTFTSNFATNYPDLTAIEALSGVKMLPFRTSSNTWGGYYIIDSISAWKLTRFANVPSFTGNSGKVLTVNSAETGVSYNSVTTTTNIDTSEIWHITKNISLISTGTTQISVAGSYTNFVPIKIKIVITAYTAGSGSVDPIISMGNNSTSYNNMVTATTLSSPYLYKVYTIDPAGLMLTSVTTSPIYLNITTAATYTTMTVAIFISGVPL